MVLQRFAKMVSRPPWRVLLEAPDFEVCQLSSRSAPLCFCSVKSSRESSFFSHFVLTWDFLDIHFCDHIHFRSILHPPENSWAMKRWGGTNSLWRSMERDWWWLMSCSSAQALTHRDFWLVALLCSSGPIHFKHLLMRSELWSLCCNCPDCDRDYKHFGKMFEKTSQVHLNSWEVFFQLPQVPQVPLAPLIQQEPQADASDL